MFPLIGLSATAVAAVLAFFTSAPAAQAGPSNGATGRCLESQSNRVYTSLSTICGGRPSQQWDLGSGTTLTNSETKLCLDSDSNRVYTSTCNGGSYQKWALGSGTTLRNLATGLCLDSAGENVYTAPCDGRRSQQWNGI